MAIFCAFRCDYHVGNSGSCLDERNKKIYGNGKLVVLFYARTEETLAIVYIEYNKYSGNISIGLPPDLRIDVLPFGGFYDENEQKESVENIVEIVSHKQTILEREE